MDEKFDSSYKTTKKCSDDCADAKRGCYAYHEGHECMFKDRCCFCDSVTGALIKLWQGWCCVSCFKKLILDSPEQSTNGDESE